MALFDLELRPQDHQLKSFGLFWLPGFCLLAALLAWLRFDQQLLAQGWTDALRHLHPAERVYTFWDYMRFAWQRDAGLRIDQPGQQC